MKHLQLFVALVMMLVVPTSVYAQSQEKPKQYTISGVVYDTNKQPLMGVTVYVKNKPGVGVATDIDGKFKITVDANSTVVFTMVSMKSHEVLVTKDRKNLKIVLEESVSELGQVEVTTGYTQQKKISVVGAITNVNVEELKTPATSITNMLGGRVAGILTRQDSGEPGQNVSNFWIRGISTFGAGQGALVLIDGLEGDLNTLDPDDIESFAVLKDASATAVYGVRGANGVIIVKTKTGRQGKLNINARFTLKLSHIKRLPEYLGAYDYALLANEARAMNGGDDIYTKLQLDLIKNNLDRELYPDVNWIDQIMKRNSWQQNYYASAQGGGEVARYFLSLGYQNESAAYKQADTKFKEPVSYRKLTYRANINMNLTKLTELSFMAQGWLTHAVQPGGTNTNQIWGSVLRLSPLMFPVTYDDGTLPTYGSEDLSSPYALLNYMGYVDNMRQDTKLSLVLNQKFRGALEGLNLRLSATTELLANYSESRRISPAFYRATGRTPQGKLIKSLRIRQRDLSYGRSENTFRKYYLEAQGNWSKIIGNHNLGAFLLYYMEQYQSTATPVDNIGLRNIPHRRQNVSGRLSYGFQNTYFIDANFGYTGSAQFKTGERFGLFPSIAAGWVPTSYASVAEKLPWLNMLKIRGSYGLAGNDNIVAGVRFPYLTLINNHAGVAWGYRGSGIREYQIGADNLQWEVSKKSNLGIDAYMFDNRLNFTVDVFRDVRDHIYQQRVTLPDYLGLVTIPQSNVGRMHSFGSDGNISYTHVFNKDINATIRANYTFSQNIVDYFEENKLPYDYKSVTGKPYNIVRGFISEGLFKSREEIETSPIQQFGVVRPGDIKYRDVNGDGVINFDDQVPLSYWNQMPRVMYGVGADVRYKNLTLGFLLRGTAKMEYYRSGWYNNGRGWVPFYDGDLGNVIKLANNPKNRWTPAWYSGTKATENPNAEFPRLSYGNNNNNAQLSSFWKRDGSYIRLQEVSLRYQFKNNPWIKKAGLKSIDFEFVANNLFTIDKVKYFDPEQASKNGAAYPIPASYALQLYFKF